MTLVKFTISFNLSNVFHCIAFWKDTINVIEGHIGFNQHHNQELLTGALLPFSFSVIHNVLCLESATQCVNRSQVECTMVGGK